MVGIVDVTEVPVTVKLSYKGPQRPSAVPAVPAVKTKFRKSSLNNSLEKY